MSQSWKAKHKKRYNHYNAPAPKRGKYGSPLTAGVKGFMLTCNMKEAECLREGYNILDEYYEKMYRKREVKVDMTDVEKQLEAELNEMKFKSKKFHQLSTNCKNVVFVQSPEEVDPLAVTEQIIKDIRIEKSQKTRHLLRFIPVVHTCKCSVESIEDAMRELLATRDEDFLDYMVVCKVRNNDEASSLHLIEVIANIVRQEKPHWKVKFDNPALTINADVICKVCCLSFLADFAKNKKYNLYELSQSVINGNENVTKVKKEEEANETVKTEVKVEQSNNDPNSVNIETKVELEEEQKEEESDASVASVNSDVPNEENKKIKIYVEISESAGEEN